jgi:hypothetical protein
MTEDAEKWKQVPWLRFGAEAMAIIVGVRMLRSLFRLGPFVLVLVVLLGCKDGTGLSRLKVHVSAHPQEVVGTREPCVNAVCVLCKYVIKIQTTQGTLTDLEWTGTRQVFEFATGTNTLDLSAEESLRRFSAQTTSTLSAQWAWGGPEHLVPVAITETFFFKRKSDQRPDSAGYTFICR